MFAVIVSYNFDPEREVVVLEDKKMGKAYLNWAWETNMNEEFAAGNDLDEDACYHEEEFAKIIWKNGDEMWFDLVEVKSPNKEFVKSFHDRYL